MTDRYVNPAVGSSGAGTSWATAYKTLAEATAAAAANETIYFANGTADVITADATYTCADGVRVISTSDTTNNPPTTYAVGATISSTTSNVDVTVNGVCSWYGVTIALGASTYVDLIRLAYSAGDQQNYVDCTFSLNGTGATSSILLGNSSGVSADLNFTNCTFTWTATGHGFTLNINSKFIACDMSGGSVHPAILFEVIGAVTIAELTGCDLSDISTIFENNPSGAFLGILSQCKLKASATMFAPIGYGLGNVYVYDCNSGDTHISLGHYNYLGNTTISTSVYCNDNIADSNLSWVVAGSAIATKTTPYESPWIDVYHTGTSAITPYLEVLRVAGSPANGVSYLESEAWINVIAKTTSGSTKSTLYSNRANPLDTTTDNTDSAKGTSDWTGEDASNNWFGKLILNSSITPAEAGYIRAQACVAGEFTLYVDPQIRGLS